MNNRLLTIVCLASFAGSIFAEQKSSDSYETYSEISLNEQKKPSITQEEAFSLSTWLWEKRPSLAESLMFTFGATVNLCAIDALRNDGAFSATALRSAKNAVKSSLELARDNKVAALAGALATTALGYGVYRWYQSDKTNQDDKSALDTIKSYITVKNTLVAAGITALGLAAAAAAATLYFDGPGSAALVKTGGELQAGIKDIACNVSVGIHKAYLFANRKSLPYDPAVCEFDPVLKGAAYLAKTKLSA